MISLPEPSTRSNLFVARIRAADVVPRALRALWSRLARRRRRPQARAQVWTSHHLLSHPLASKIFVEQEQDFLFDLIEHRGPLTATQSKLLENLSYRLAELSAPAREMFDS